MEIQPVFCSNCKAHNTMRTWEAGDYRCRKCGWVLKTRQVLAQPDQLSLFTMDPGRARVDRIPIEGSSCVVLVVGGQTQEDWIRELEYRRARLECPF